jgi:hypothetical protein
VTVKITQVSSPTGEQLLTIAYDEPKDSGVMFSLQITQSELIKAFQETPVPSVSVGTSTSSIAASYPVQRKIFYANGLFWVFFSDGTNMVYYTSPDGVTWSIGASSPVRAATDGPMFSIWFDGGYLHYAYSPTGATAALYYRRGTPNADGSITWSAAEQTVTASDDIDVPFVCADDGGYPWIGASTSAGSTNRPKAWKSSTNDGTWVTDAGFPYSLNSPAGASYVEIIPLTNQRVLAICALYNGLLFMQSYTGAIWNALVWSVSNVNGGAMHSAVAQGDDVHIAFAKQNTYDLIYVKYTYSTNSLGAEVTIQAATLITTYPVLSANAKNNDLYCFWYGSPTAYHVYYKKYSGGSWDTLPTDWEDESGHVLTGDGYLSGFYRNFDSCICLIYLTGVISPYTLRFATLQLSLVFAKQSLLDIVNKRRAELSSSFDFTPYIGVELET